jgi:ketosteroid isomerase-like protein
MMGSAAVQSVDEATVLAAARGLVAAFARHDTRAYFDAFAPEASFIFPSTPAVLPSRAAYEQLWAEWEETLGFQVRACDSTQQQVQCLGEVAVFHHQVRTTLHFAADGEVTLDERETIVFARQASGRWLAVHEHLSPLPANTVEAA